MAGRKQPHGLTEADRALWERVKASVKPLHPAPKRTPAVAQPAGPVAPSNRPKRAAPAVFRAHAPAQRIAPPQAAADRKDARAIAAGKIGIDARLDLHGMRQAEAYRALAGFLRAAQLRRHRLVLIITGRGDSEAAFGRFHADSPRGVLRAAVPHWLQEPAFASIVAGWSPAHRRHGGDGALYVRLRRKG